MCSLLTKSRKLVGLNSEYALFTVDDEILDNGMSPATIQVTWYNTLGKQAYYSDRIRVDLIINWSLRPRFCTNWGHPQEHKN